MNKNIFINDFPLQILNKFDFKVDDGSGIALKDVEYKSGKILRDIATTFTASMLSKEIG